MVVPYATSAICRYTIQVPDDAAHKSLTLLVNAFDVEQDDYMQVYDGADDTAKKMFGGKGFGGAQRPPPTFQSELGHIHVVFASNPIRSGRGWNMTFSTSELFWRAVLCNTLSTNL